MPVPELADINLRQSLFAGASVLALLQPVTKKAAIRAQSIES